MSLNSKHVYMTLKVSLIKLHNKIWTHPFLPRAVVISSQSPLSSDQPLLELPQSCQSFKILSLSQVEFSILCGVSLNGPRLLSLCTFTTWIMDGKKSNFILSEDPLHFCTFSTFWLFSFRTFTWWETWLSRNGLTWVQTDAVITFVVWFHFWPHINSRMSCFARCSTSISSRVNSIQFSNSEFSMRSAFWVFYPVEEFFSVWEWS